MPISDDRWAHFEWWNSEDTEYTAAPQHHHRMCIVTRELKWQMKDAVALSRELKDPLHSTATAPHCATARRRLVKAPVVWPGLQNGASYIAHYIVVVGAISGRDNERDSSTRK